MNIKKGRSLRIKMLVSMVTGIALALVILFLFSLLSDLWMNRSYMSEKSVEGRRLYYFEKLQEYVTENQLASTDTARMTEWVEDNRWVSLTLYKDSKLLFEYEPDAEDAQDDVLLPDAEEGTYSLRMRDGILLATVAEYSHYYIRMTLRLTGGLAAGLAFCLVLLYVFRHTTHRIMALADGVARIGEGDLMLTVGDEEGDEISALGTTVNQMRDAIVEKMEKEQAAWQANTDLITTMSHDVRTPLTVLMGYLDLIKAETDPEKTKEYADACQRTALRLKHLSDDLFRSFLVIRQTEEPASMQGYDVSILFEQILAERSILLSEDGFTVESHADVPPGTRIVADTDMLLRIIDNLSSNIRKYADPAAPVEIQLTAEESYCALTVTNREKKMLPHQKESTGIGFRSCAKLAAAMDGTFTWGRKKDRFYARLMLKRE